MRTAPWNPEELFKRLAKKGMPPFASAVLGFTLGSLMDYGVTEEEARALCDYLLTKIAEAKKNPAIVDTAKKFGELIEKTA